MTVMILLEKQFNIECPRPVLVTISDNFIGIDSQQFKLLKPKLTVIWFTIGNMCLVIVTIHNNTYFVDTVNNVSDDQKSSSVKKGCETFEPLHSLFGLSKNQKQVPIKSLEIKRTFLFVQRNCFSM